MWRRVQCYTAMLYPKPNPVLLLHSGRRMGNKDEVHIFMYRQGVFRNLVGRGGGVEVTNTKKSKLIYVIERSKTSKLGNFFCQFSTLSPLFSSVSNYLWKNLVLPDLSLVTHQSELLHKCLSVKFSLTLVGELMNSIWYKMLSLKSIWYHQLL